MDHGKDIADRNMNFLSGGGVRTNLNSGCTQHRPNVVGLLGTLLGTPRDVMLVREYGCAESGTVVTTQANHHETGCRDCQLQNDATEQNKDLPRFTNGSRSLKLECLRSGLYNILAVLVDNLSTAVHELGSDMLVGVDGVGGLNSQVITSPSRSWVNGNEGLGVAVGGVVSRRIGGRLGCHDDQ